MADDPNPALRSELVAAIATVDQQIRGLRILDAAPKSSDELLAEIAKQIAARERRSDLINHVIQWLDGALQALNALQADGYPALPTAPIPTALLSELRGENTDLEAAVGLFSEMAVSVGLDVPHATVGEQPVPT